MTQTQSAPPATWSPPAQQPSTWQAPAAAPGRRGAIARWFEGTPGRMRAVLILATHQVPARPDILSPAWTTVSLD